MLNEQLDMINQSIRSSMCEHKSIEYDFDYGDGFPMLLGGVCEDCGKDFDSSDFSDEDHIAITQDESANVISRAIDDAVDHQRDIDAGLI